MSPLGRLFPAWFVARCPILGASGSLDVRAPYKYVYLLTCNASSSHEPAVSIAISQKIWVAVKAWYFVVFNLAACCAAVLASIHVVCRCDAAYVSGIVTSQANALPLDHDMSVTPASRLPFCRTRPVRISRVATNVIIFETWNCGMHNFFQRFLTNLSMLNLNLMDARVASLGKLRFSRLRP